MFFFLNLSASKYDILNTILDIYGGFSFEKLLMIRVMLIQSAFVIHAWLSKVTTNQIKL